MPAYSFKEQFVPLVENGTKRQTIRAFRKRHVPFPGQLAHLYYGMRTRQCRKLIANSPKIIDVQCIYIDECNITLIDTPMLTPSDKDHILKTATIPLNHIGKWLTKDEKEQLAKKDGFSGIAQMLSFWRSTHSLPFIGNIIYW